jgi:hypothetical protein
VAHGWPDETELVRIRYHANFKKVKHIALPGEIDSFESRAVG